MNSQLFMSRRNLLVTPIASAILPKVIKLDFSAFRSICPYAEGVILSLLAIVDCDKLYASRIFLILMESSIFILISANVFGLCVRAGNRSTNVQFTTKV